MLLENFKPAHFPYSINLLSSVLVQDSVLTFTRPSTKEIRGTKYLCVKSVPRRTGNTSRSLEGRKKPTIGNMISTLKHGMLFVSMTPGHYLFL